MYSSRVSRQKLTLILGLAIFVVSFAIRLFGIGWGLKNDLHNQSYHPDEPLIFDFANKSHLYSPPSMHEYYNYGTLYYAVLRGAAALGSINGEPRPDDLETASFGKTSKFDYNSYASQFHLWGRYASAFAGAMTAALIFLALAPFVGWIGAGAGAAFIAFSPAHLEHSRFQTVDVVSLFFLALATLASLRLLRLEGASARRWMAEAALAGALCGLAGGTRFSNVLVVLSVLAALTIRRPQNWLALAGIAVLAAGLSFVIATPGIVTDTQYFLANQQYQLEHAKHDTSLIFVGRPSGYLLHIQYLFEGVTTAASFLGLGGLLWAGLTGRKWAWVVLAFFVPYYLSIGGMELKYLRYGFPLYLGTAAGFGFAIGQLRKNTSRLLAGLAATLCMWGFAAPQQGLNGDLLFTRWMMQTDPRDEAGMYLKNIAKAQPDMSVGFLGESPWFWSAAMVPDASVLKFLPPEERAAYLADTRAPRVVSFMSGEHPEYATYSSFEAEDALRLKNRTDIPIERLGDVVQANGMFDALYQSYLPDRTFGGDGPTIHDLEYIRPTIYVLKRKE